MDPNATTPVPAPDSEKPKQYIRTFHGDLETVKKGGTPNLAPLGEPTPSGRLITPAPIPAIPAPAPAAPANIQPPFQTPPPAVPPPVSAPAPMPMPAPISAPPPVQPPPSIPPPPAAVPEAPRAASLETYAGDFTERMKRTQASTATVLAAEQDATPRLVQSQPKQKMSLSSILYTAAGVVLLIAALFGGYVAYVRYLASSSPVMLAPTVSAPIFVDEREQVSGTGAALSQAVAQLVTRPLSSGAVRLLYLGSATSSAASVFSALQLPAPGALLRNIQGGQSMAGVVNIGGTQSAFFILSVTSFGDTFAAMLQWEPRMPRDLAKLFAPYPAPAPSAPVAVATSTAASATSTVSAATTSAPQTPAPTAPSALPVFVDTTIANHDVRAYRDAAGRDVLVYGYWNRTTLVIARDAAAFSEIVGRLAISRAQ